MGRQMQVGWVKIGHFQRKTRYNSKTVQDRRIVSIKVEQEVDCNHFQMGCFCSCRICSDKRVAQSSAIAELLVQSRFSSRFLHAYLDVVFMVCVSVCVIVTHKRLNRLRCRLERDLCLSSDDTHWIHLVDTTERSVLGSYVGCRCSNCSDLQGRM